MSKKLKIVLVIIGLVIICLFAFNKDFRQGFTQGADKATELAK